MESIRFYFYLGPRDLSASFNFLPYAYEVEKVKTFVMLGGRKLYTGEHGVKTLGLPLSDIERINEMIRRGILLSQWEKITKKVYWLPPIDVEENSWLCYMINENEEVVGYYQGGIYRDELGRDYSAHSLINIRPDYRGRSLCKELAYISYKNLAKFVDYICIVNGAENKDFACVCYNKAAQRADLLVDEREGCSLLVLYKRGIDVTELGCF